MWEGVQRDLHFYCGYKETDELIWSPLQAQPGRFWATKNGGIDEKSQVNTWISKLVYGKLSVERLFYTESETLCTALSLSWNLMLVFCVSSVWWPPLKMRNRLWRPTDIHLSQNIQLNQQIQQSGRREEKTLSRTFIVFNISTNLIQTATLVNNRTCPMAYTRHGMIWTEQSLSLVLWLEAK